MEITLTKVTTVVPGDVIFFTDEEKPRTIVLPRDDVIRPVTANGKPVRDTSGKEVKIVHKRSWLESCTDSSMIHLHTNRGVLCVHRETVVERKVD